jgi:hypothetical protein
VTGPEIITDDAEWLAKNQANHNTRRKLLIAEGKLLELLQNLGDEMKILDERTTAAQALADQTDEPNGFERVVRLRGEQGDQIWLEAGLIDRIAKNQDEQQVLLEALIETPSPDQIAQEEAERDSDHGEVAYGRPLGHMRAVIDLDRDGEQEWSRLQEQIDRLMKLVE